MALYGKIVVIKRNGSDGALFPLTQHTCQFGRSNDCDIRIQLPNVSKEHCKITVNTEGQVFLENLSEVNPTVLNTKPVTNIVKLAHKDVFTIIDRSFRFEFPPTSAFRSPTKAGPSRSPLKPLTPRAPDANSNNNSAKTTPKTTSKVTPKKTPKVSAPATALGSPLVLPAKAKTPTKTPKSKSPAKSPNKGTPKIMLKPSKKSPKKASPAKTPAAKVATPKSKTPNAASVAKVATPGKTPAQQPATPKVTTPKAKSPGRQPKLTAATKLETPKAVTPKKKKVPTATLR